MKINKEFAPITITLETVEDRNQFLNILEAAYRKTMENCYDWKGFHKPQSNLGQHIEYMRNKLM